VAALADDAYELAIATADAVVTRRLLVAHQCPP